MRFLLQNRCAAQLSFRVALEESVARPTLRKGGIKLREVMIGPHKVHDASLLLGVPHTEIPALFLASPEWRRLDATGALALVDLDDLEALQKASEEATEAQRVSAAQRLASMPTPEQLMDAARAQSKVGIPYALQDNDPVMPIVRMAQAQTFDSVSAVAEASSAPGALENQSQRQGGQAPDPNAFVDIEASQPSSRWTREALMSYAETRGIKIAPTASKNVVLKKIREASK